jgi:subtilase family serine protease
VTTATAATTVADPGAPFRITTAVRNQGGQASSASVVRFFLAKTGAPDVLLTESRSIVALAPGASAPTLVTTVTIPSNTAPSSGPADTYFIKVKADADGVVDEADETNNVRATGAFMVVAAAPAMIRGTAAEAPWPQ